MNLVQWLVTEVTRHLTPNFWNNFELWGEKYRRKRENKAWTVLSFYLQHMHKQSSSLSIFHMHAFKSHPHLSVFVHQQQQKISHTQKDGGKAYLQMFMMACNLSIRIITQCTSLPFKSDEGWKRKDLRFAMCIVWSSQKQRNVDTPLFQSIRVIFLLWDLAPVLSDGYLVLPRVRHDSHCQTSFSATLTNISQLWNLS